MKLTIFGATGSVGKLLVPNLLAKGHEIKILTRNPQNLPNGFENVEAITGDVTDPSAVGKAIEGADAVYCLLGAPLRDTSRIRERGTKVIVDEMKKHNIHRIICLSAFGTGETWKLMPWSYRTLLGPLLLNRMFDDHNAQEKILKNSPLNWTFVRPVNLVDDPTNVPPRRRSGYPIAGKNRAESFSAKRRAIYGRNRFKSGKRREKLIGWRVEATNNSAFHSFGRN